MNDASGHAATNASTPRAITGRAHSPPAPVGGRKVTPRRAPQKRTADDKTWLHGTGTVAIALTPIPRVGHRKSRELGRTGTSAGARWSASRLAIPSAGWTLPSTSSAVL